MMNALIVDDSRPIRRIESEILRELGFDTCEACHGKQALERLQSAPLPDVVLVDWNMPEMTGVEFVRRARAIERTRRIPMVMVTSEKTVAKIEEALDQAGADAFISKPFTVEEMQQKLQKLVEKATSQEGCVRIPAR